MAPSKALALPPRSRQWGYSGDTGPSAWEQLSEAFQLCGIGHQQSPIDLAIAEGAGLEIGPEAIAYRDGAATLRNTGYTLQVDIPEGNALQLDGETFTLRQFHFHTPSEHQVGGSPFPMELHLVHVSAAGNIAVLAIFCREGQENLSLQPVWQRLADSGPAIQVSLPGLLPGDRHVVRYSGSLTTPPCLEPVRWVVFRQPIEVSRAQLDAFRARFAPNARPVQPLFGRVLQ